jgi:hypothetical protein
MKNRVMMKTLWRRNRMNKSNRFYQCHQKSGIILKIFFLREIFSNLRMDWELRVILMEEIFKNVWKFSLKIFISVGKINLNSKQIFKLKVFLMRYFTHLKCRSHQIHYHICQILNRVKQGFFLLSLEFNKKKKNLMIKVFPNIFRGHSDFILKV